MIFRQILHPATGCASYVFGCTGKQKLAAVDPHAAHIDDYLAVAEAAASPIVAIFETHLHADHPSGAAELARRTGAPVYLYQGTEVDFPHTPVRDGDEVPLGNDYVRVLHTPGHSPHSMSLLVGDRVRGDAHWFILTGDAVRRRRGPSRPHRRRHRRRSGWRRFGPVRQPAEAAGAA